MCELAKTLARGKTPRTTEELSAHIVSIARDSWLRRVLVCELTGNTPATHKLTDTVTETAKEELEEEVFGKRVLVTTQEHWPITDVVAAYRSQSDAEFGFRQLKDPHVVSFSPVHHFTEHNIRVHTFTCVLALQIFHLMRREAEDTGLHLSVRELLDQLAGVGVEELRGLPRSGQRPCFGLTVANHARDHHTGIVEHGPERVAERVAELATLMDRARGGGGHVA